MNICPKKSEIVFQWFWGILKRSVMVNQASLKLSICFSSILSIRLFNSFFFIDASEYDQPQTCVFNIQGDVCEFVYPAKKIQVNSKLTKETFQLFQYCLSQEYF